MEQVTKSAIEKTIEAYFADYDFLMSEALRDRDKEDLILKKLLKNAADKFAKIKDLVNS